MVTLRTRRPLGLLGQLMLGSICFGVGAVFLYFLAADYTLVCSRTNDSCSLQKIRLFNRSESLADFRLSDLRRAEIQESRNSKGKSHYQVMLATKDIRIPLSDGLHVGYGSCAKITTDINTYLGSKSDTLSVGQSGTLLKLFGFVFAAAGAVVLLQAFATCKNRFLKIVRG